MKVLRRSEPDQGVIPEINVSLIWSSKQRRTGTGNNKVGTGRDILQKSAIIHGLILTFADVRDVVPGLEDAVLLLESGHPGVGDDAAMLQVHQSAPPYRGIQLLMLWHLQCNKNQLIPYWLVLWIRVGLPFVTPVLQIPVSYHR
jgi:hypothetical protein